MKITPLDADRFTRVVRCFITVQIFRSMPGDEQETFTRQDLTEFRTYSSNSGLTLLSSLLSLRRLLPRPSVHYPSLNSSKSRASSIKFSYPEHERNYNFSLDVFGSSRKRFEGTSCLRFSEGVHTFERFHLTYKGTQQKDSNR